MSGARLVVVDDDPAILRSLRRSLEGHGYAVKTLESGGPTEALVRDFRPDVVLLDLVLPDTDGIAITRAIRAWSEVPIILLSAVGDERAKVTALDEGADDYLTKPFNMNELLARVRVALRRTAGGSREPVLQAGPIAMDLATREVRVGGVPTHLTPKEFDLCRLLLRQEGRVLTQRFILAEVWGPEYVDDAHILRTFVHQLRAKLEAAQPCAGALIANDPGVGYSFTSPEGRGQPGEG